MIDAKQIENKVDDVAVTRKQAETLREIRDVMAARKGVNPTVLAGAFVHVGLEMMVHRHGRDAVAAWLRREAADLERTAPGGNA